MDTNIILGYLKGQKEIEECAITLRRQTRMKLPDCIVAATAIENGCVLVTNDKDLAKKQINGLKSIQSL